jgi:hypothetical protein
LLAHSICAGVPSVIDKNFNLGNLAANLSLFIAFAFVLLVLIQVYRSLATLSTTLYKII